MSQFFMFFLFFLVVSLSSVFATETEDAIRECGNLHRTDMHNIVDARAVYSNNKCTLTCYAGNKTLSTNPLNEGYVCDAVSQRKCHNGHCSGDTAEAVHECGNLHRLDLTQYQTNGTEYSADQCTLKCVIDGKVASVNPVNEGLVCSGAASSNGICRKGSCVLDSTQNPNESTNATTVPTTILTKATTMGTITAPVPFNPNSYKIDNITFIIKEAILRETSIYEVNVHIVTSYCHTENIPYTSSKIVWNQNCVWNYVFTENDSNIFYFVINELDRATHTVYTYTLLRKYLSAHPNSVAQHKVEFVEVFQLLDRNDFSRIWGDLYVNFTINFHKI